MKIVGRKFFTINPQNNVAEPGGNCIYTWRELYLQSPDNKSDLNESPRLFDRYTSE